jgi:hypothetical protein
MKRWLVRCAVGVMAVGVAAAQSDDNRKSQVLIDLDQPAVSAPAKPATAPATKQTTGKTDTTSKPKSKAPAAKKDAKKKPEAPRKIEGLEIPRKGAGFLGIKIEGGNFVLSFYDKDKKPVAADVSRAVLRWPVHYQPNDERTQLEPTSDGKTFTSAKVVRPPFTFKLYLTLLKDAAPNEPVATEEYIVDFQP